MKRLLFFPPKATPSADEHARLELLVDMLVQCGDALFVWAETYPAWLDAQMPTDCARTLIVRLHDEPELTAHDIEELVDGECLYGVVVWMEEPSDLPVEAVLTGALAAGVPVIMVPNDVIVARCEKELSE